MRLLTFGSLLTALAVAAGGAWAGPNIARFDEDYAKTRAHRHANMDSAECVQKLEALGTKWRGVPDAAGVLVPVRLEGPVGGVLYRTDFPDARRATVPYEVFDCRLVLALHDFSVLLRAHDVVEVRMFSAYRPPSKRWPKRRVAKRHPGALAIDIRELRKANGDVLNVESHWEGGIGLPPCGEGSADPAAPEGRELAALFCEAADARIFQSMLSPNHDRAHANHFHLDLAAGVKWFIVH